MRGGLSPADKATLIRALNEHDTLMVGDGIDDAPAFRAAWCARTPAIDRPAFSARADFYLVGSGLGPVAEALAMTAHVQQTVVRNLWFAVVYNHVAAALRRRPAEGAREQDPERGEQDKEGLDP